MIHHDLRALSVKDDAWVDKISMVVMQRRKIVRLLQPEQIEWCWCKNVQFLLLCTQAVEVAPSGFAMYGYIGQRRSFLSNQGNYILWAASSETAHQEWGPSLLPA